jgi:hypothetical protein
MRALAGVLRCTARAIFSTRSATACPSRCRHAVVRALLLLVAMQRTLIAAVLAAASLAWGDVQIGINIGTPPIAIPAPPNLVVVPGSTVYYDPGLPMDVFVHADVYYTHHHGRWYSAPAYGGPWRVCHHRLVPRPVLGVPWRYYKHVPPGHLKKVAHKHRHGHGRGHGRRGG